LLVDGAAAQGMVGIYAFPPSRRHLPEQSEAPTVHRHEERDYREPRSTAAWANAPPHGIDQLVTLAKTRPKRLQYRPELLDGFLGQTELVLQPVPPRPAQTLAFHIL